MLSFKYIPDAIFIAAHMRTILTKPIALLQSTGQYIFQGGMIQ